MLPDHTEPTGPETCATSNKFGVRSGLRCRPRARGAEEPAGEENGQRETEERTPKFSSTSPLQAAQGQLRRPRSLPRASGRVPLPVCLGDSIPHAGAPEHLPRLETPRGL